MASFGMKQESLLSMKKSDVVRLSQRRGAESGIFTGNHAAALHRPPATPDQQKRGWPKLLRKEGNHIDCRNGWNRNSTMILGNVVEILGQA